MKKYFLSFLVGMLFTGGLFQLDIGLPNFNKTNIQKATKLIKSKKIKLKKSIFKKATARTTTIFAETAIPLLLVGASIAGTTVIAITADDYCEIQNTLDNIVLVLEGKPEKKVSITECSNKVIKASKEAVLKSGIDIHQWVKSSYKNSSKWIKRKYGSTSDWVSNQWTSTFGK